MTTSIHVGDDDLRDMQGLIGSGFNSLRHSEYALLDVTHAARALQWLRSVRHHVHSVSSLVGRDLNDEANARPVSQHKEAWSIAFTFRGLVQLGVVENEEAPFSSEFRSGQAAPLCRRLLRDATDARPWAWGDVPVYQEADASTRDSGAVSILVIRLAEDPNVPERSSLDEACLGRQGLRLVRRIRGCAGSFRTSREDKHDSSKTGVEPAKGKLRTHLHEPFGFRDGVSQPLPDGLRFARARKHLQRSGAVATHDDHDDDRIPLGEFVLGHTNAYQEQSHCPDVLRPAAKPGPSDGRRAWPFGRNGSYLAVRQIHQDVTAFRAFEAHCEAEGRPDLPERLIGRRKDGSPLQACPTAIAGHGSFRFRMNDSQGFQCPLGAHVRRANPRDALARSVGEGVAASKLHRLLRRGRPYASGSGPCNCPASRKNLEPVGSDGSDSCATGVFFIALVADLARQFEFVQRLWVGNPRFANLNDSEDPIVSHGSGHGFPLPGVPIGTRTPRLSSFTHVEGGGYFFLPGLSALERLARGEFAASTGSEAYGGTQMNLPV